MDQEKLSQITITGISMTIARLDAIANLLIDIRASGNPDLGEQIYDHYRQSVEASTKQLTEFLTQHYTAV
jgi:hypothetical protein